MRRIIRLVAAAMSSAAASAATAVTGGFFGSRHWGRGHFGGTYWS